MQAIASLLASAGMPLSLDDIAVRFDGKGKWKSRLPELVATLAALGRAREVEAGRWMG